MSNRPNLWQKGCSWSPPPCSSPFLQRLKLGTSSSAGRHHRCCPIHMLQRIPPNEAWCSEPLLHRIGLQLFWVSLARVFILAKMGIGTLRYQGFLFLRSMNAPILPSLLTCMIQSSSKLIPVNHGIFGGGGYSMINHSEWSSSQPAN